MASDVAAIITALGGLISITLGALAFFLRQKSQSGRPAELLRRLWNWLEDNGVVDGRTEVGPVPDSLRRDVTALLDAGAEEGKPS